MSDGDLLRVHDFEYLEHLRLQCARAETEEIARLRGPPAADDAARLEGRGMAQPPG